MYSVVAEAEGLDTLTQSTILMFPLFSVQYFSAKKTSTLFLMHGHSEI